MSASITYPGSRPTAGPRRARIMAIAGTVVIAGAGIAAQLTGSEHRAATPQEVTPVTAPAPPSPTPVTSVSEPAGGPDLGPLRAD